MTGRLTCLLLLVTLLLAGCGQTVPEPTLGGTVPPGATLEPVVSPLVSPAAPPTALPSSQQNSFSPQNTTSLWNKRYFVAQSSTLSLSKAPAVGEEVQLTFDFSGSSYWTGTLKASIVFERYDPGLYYPLGRGDEVDEALDMVANNWGDAGLRAHFIDVAKDQPDSTVPLESVLVSGNTTWEGTPKDTHKGPKNTPTIRLPQEGEWLVASKLQAGDLPPHYLNQIHLTVGKDSGTFGWLTDDKGSRRGGWTAPFPDNPLSITIKPGSPAPLVGQPFHLKVSIRSLDVDLTQAEGHLQFFRREGSRLPYVPLKEVLTDGSLTWQGAIKNGETIELQATVVFPQEGDWGIYDHTSAWPGIGNTKQQMYFHIGKDKSRFGWTESHEAPTYDPLYR